MFNLILAAMKKGFFKKIIGSITNGSPLIRTIKSVILPTVKKDDNGKDITIPPQPVTPEFIFRLIIEAASVWGLVWLMYKYGISLEDIATLWGLVH